jgi:hypothetical protein
LGLATLSFNSFAGDGGVVGPVYSITEEDGIEMIQKSIGKIDPEVIKKRLLEHYREEGNVSLDFPRTVQSTNRYIEPQAILSGDIKDHNGKVLFVKGTVYNPLEKMMGKRTYLIIDGTDSKQLAWMQKSLLEVHAKVMVTKGNVFDLSKQFKTMIYPARKEILEVLCVTSVPTKVTQEGKLLHVETVVP